MKKFVSFAPKVKREAPKAETAQTFPLHNLKEMVIKKRRTNNVISEFYSECLE